MRGIDIFDMFRLLLLIAGGTYTVIRTFMAVSMMLAWPDEAGPRLGRTLRSYMTTQLLRTRLRRFAFEILQIVLLVALLVYLAYLNMVRL